MSNTLLINNISFYQTDESHEVRENALKFQNSCMGYAEQFEKFIQIVEQEINKLGSMKGVMRVTNVFTTSVSVVGNLAGAGFVLDAGMLLVDHSARRALTTAFRNTAQRVREICELRYYEDEIQRKNFFNYCQELNDSCNAMRDMLPNEYRVISDFGLVRLAVSDPGTDIVFNVEDLKEEMLYEDILRFGPGTGQQKPIEDYQDWTFAPIIGTAPGFGFSFDRLDTIEKGFKKFQNELFKMKWSLDALRSQWMYFAGFTKEDCTITYGFEARERWSPRHGKQILKVSNFFYNDVAGVKVGDRIVEIRGKRVSSLLELYEVWTEDLEDDFITFQLERHGQKFDVEVEVGAFPFWMAR